MSIDTIFFDLDGTLVDTADDICYAVNKVLVNNNHKKQNLNKIKPYIAQGVKIILTNILPKVDDNTLDNYHKQILSVYAHNINKYSKYFTNTELVIKTIKDNNMKWGIITNKSKKFTYLLLNALNIKPDIVVCGDTLEHNKPHPEQLLYAVKKLHTSTDKCLFIGDDYNDMLAATNANIKSVAISYGYNTPKANWQANHIVHNPKQILEVINAYL